MKIRFEVRVPGGSWVEAIYGTILQYNRLSYRLPDGCRGIAAVGGWRLSEATLSDPIFKKACWDALSHDEKMAALLRKNANASTGVHCGAVYVT